MGFLFCERGYWLMGFPAAWVWLFVSFPCSVSILSSVKKSISISAFCIYITIKVTPLNINFILCMFDCRWYINVCFCFISTDYCILFSHTIRPPPPLLFGVGGSFNGATCMTMNMIKVDVWCNFVHYHCIIYSAAGFNKSYAFFQMAGINGWWLVVEHLFRTKSTVG